MEIKALCNPASHARKVKRECVTKTMLVMRSTMGRSHGSVKKTLIMSIKLTGIILLAGFLQVSARGSAQTVTYRAEAIPLGQVFSVLEKQTGYVFFYNSRDLEGANSVTVNLQQVPLQQALERILAGQPLGFVIRGRTILINRRIVPVPREGDTTHLLSRPIDIHGRVTDTTGKPIVGATITVKGTQLSTESDVGGNFSLHVVNNTGTIIVTYVGFESQEIRLKGRSDFAIRLKVHSTTLLDVVVSKGYYNTTNRLNTGNVATVSGEDIARQPVTDPILALEGRVPGLYIQQSSGVPGSYGAILIRGQNSIVNGSDPLYIVDGVPYGSTTLTSNQIGGGILGLPNEYSPANNALGMSPFNSINPGDIESVEVLKDADATAIYGSRGANGVILITTKKGKVGPTKVDINVNSGYGKITRMIPLLNTQQYLAMRHEAFANDGVSPAAYDYDINGDWDTTRYTNWQKALIGKASSFNNAQASISGGNGFTQFLISGSYNRQGMVFPGDYSDRKATGHFSLTHASSDRLFHLQFSTEYTADNSDLPQSDPTALVSTLPPDAPAMYDQDGNLNWQPVGGTASWLNPLRYTVQHANAISNVLISNLTMSYEILPGLQVKSSFGYTNGQMDQSLLTPLTYAPPPNNNPNLRKNNFATTETKSWIIEPQLEYQKKLAKGQLSLLVGTTLLQNISNSLAQYAKGFASDALISDPLAASITGLYGKTNSIYDYEAFFGRINYNWYEKYLINITARRDGSSRFGPGKQFGNFGAIGAGWIFSKEQLIQDNFSFLSFGKLRGSYGSTGSDQIGDYQYLSTYVPIGQSYQGPVGMAPIGLPNPYFAWEVDKKLEAGLELGFLKDKALFSVSYFHNRSGNQLLDYILPQITGYTGVTANLPATVQNTGLELILNTVNIKTKAFTWTSSVNLTVPKNKLVAFPNLDKSAYINQLAIGYSLSSKYLYHYIGVDPKTGIYTFASKDGSGVPSTPQDLAISKPITQQYYGGLQNSWNYKGFQLDVFIQFVKQTGRSYLNNFPMPGTLSNQPVYVLDRWQHPGQQSQLQGFSTGEGGSASQAAFYNLQLSDGVITDASFIRVKSLNLSYQFPSAWQKKMRLQNARIYISCQNLFTITHYQGLDPENQGPLPPLRMMTAGMQFSL